VELLEVHACAVFASEEPGGLHALARAFRAGDPDAFEEVLGLVVDALRDGLPGEGTGSAMPGGGARAGVPGASRGGAGVPGSAAASGGTGSLALHAVRVPAVAVPGHHAGTGNDACTRLITRLAAAVPWLVPAPGLLERVADAPEGRTAPDRDPAAEAETLCWHLERLPTGAYQAPIAHPGSASDASGLRPILLLDDVVRSGSTLAAAIHAAPADIAARIVPVAVFRAVPPPREGGLG
jgi:hypothetical protein